MISGLESRFRWQQAPLKCAHAGARPPISRSELAASSGRSPGVERARDAAVPESNTRPAPSNEIAARIGAAGLACPLIRVVAHDHDRPALLPEVSADESGFATTAVVTLAVGIAVNTTCLALLNNLAFRLIPAANTDGLVRVYPLTTGRAGATASCRIPTIASFETEGRSFRNWRPTSRRPLPREAATTTGDLAQPRDMLAYVVSAQLFPRSSAREPIVGRIDSTGRGSGS